MKDLKNKSVGSIVAADFNMARVFADYKIDFCCHGDNSLVAACEESGANIDEVLSSIENVKEKTAIQFDQFPLDLLIDYVLKVHHRNIRKKGPGILALLNKVAAVHGRNHPELIEMQSLFAESLQELESHLQKEENVLFPFVVDLFNAAEIGAKSSQMHCGTVANPIRVMRMEHEGEGNRYKYITQLTNNYTIPADACASYTLLIKEMKEFMDALFEHIHIENNIIFPQSIALEEKWVSNYQ